jgi:hypothetical protein
MAITLTYLKNGGVHIKIEDTLIDNDLSKATSMLYSDDDAIKAINYMLVDMSECMDILLSDEGMRDFIEKQKQVTKINNNTVAAILIDNQILKKSLIESWNLRTSHKQLCEWFDDPIDAASWVTTMEKFGWSI